MPVKQLSVFLDNSSGTLYGFTKLIGESGINLVALTIADTTSFGILRCLAANPTEILRVVTSAGYSARLTDVIAAVVPDTPGGLSRVLELLSKEEVSIEYCYSFTHDQKIPGGNSSGAALILQVNDIAKAETILTNGVVALLSQESFSAY